MMEVQAPRGWYVEPDMCTVGEPCRYICVLVLLTRLVFGHPSELPQLVSRFPFASYLMMELAWSCHRIVGAKAFSWDGRLVLEPFSPCRLMFTELLPAWNPEVACLNVEAIP